MNKKRFIRLFLLALISLFVFLTNVNAKDIYFKIANKSVNVRAITLDENNTIYVNIKDYCKAEVCEYKRVKNEIIVSLPAYQDGYKHKVNLAVSHDLFSSNVTLYAEIIILNGNLAKKTVDDYFELSSKSISLSSVESDGEVYVPIRFLSEALARTLNISYRQNGDIDINIDSLKMLTNEEKGVFYNLNVNLQAEKSDNLYKRNEIAYAQEGDCYKAYIYDNTTKKNVSQNLSFFDYTSSKLNIDIKKNKICFSGDYDTGTTMRGEIGLIILGNYKGYPVVGSNTIIYQQDTTPTKKLLLRDGNDIDKKYQTLSFSNLPLNENSDKTSIRLLNKLLLQQKLADTKLEDNLDEYSTMTKDGVKQLEQILNLQETGYITPKAVELYNLLYDNSYYETYKYANYIIPFWHQSDSFWSNLKYSGGTIYSSGCMAVSYATAMKMLNPYMAISPNVMANYLEDYIELRKIIFPYGNTFGYDKNNPEEIGYPDDRKFFQRFNIKTEYLGDDFDAIRKAIRIGKVVIFTGENIYHGIGHSFAAIKSSTPGTDILWIEIQEDMTLEEITTMHDMKIIYAFSVERE